MFYKTLFPQTPLTPQIYLDLPLYLSCIVVNLIDTNEDVNVKDKTDTGEKNTKTPIEAVALLLLCDEDSLKAIKKQA